MYHEPLNQPLTDEAKVESYTLKMATAEPLAGLPSAQAAPSTELADQWRRLTRAATAVAVLTSPALFIWFKEYNGWSTLVSLAATVGVVIVFRGFADLFFRRLIPWPSLFGADSAQLREEDVMGRRRAWYWRKKARLAFIFALVITIVWLVRGREASWLGTPRLHPRQDRRDRSRTRRSGCRSSSSSSSSSPTSRS